MRITIKELINRKKIFNFKFINARSIQRITHKHKHTIKKSVFKTSQITKSTYLSRINLFKNFKKVLFT